MNGVDSNAAPQPPPPLPPPPQQSKPSAIVFSSNNGVIDDPLIQSLAAEQAASAHNYDLLSYRHKRVRLRSEIFLVFEVSLVGSTAFALWRSINSSIEHSTATWLAKRHRPPALFSPVFLFFLF